MNYRILLILLLVCCFKGFAQKSEGTIVPISDLNQQLDLTHNLWISQASAQDLPYNSIKALNFLPLAEKDEELSSEDAYWGKITLLNTSSTVKEAILHAGTNNFTDLYIAHGNEVERQQAGELRPLSERTLPGKRKDCLFRVQLSPNTPTTLYIGIWNTTGYPPRFSATLESVEQWEKSDRGFYIWHSLFLGALLMMIGYNISVYFATAEPGYAFYAGFILAAFLYFSWYYGYVNLFVLPEYPSLSRQFWILAIIMPILYLQFARKILHLSQEHRKTDRLAKYMLILNIIVMVAALVNFWITENQARSVKWINTTLVADGLLFTVLLYRLFKNGSPLLRYFLAGISCFLFFSVMGVFSFTYLKWQEGVYLVQFGILGHILLHSVGLGQKLRAAERAQHQMHEELIQQLKKNRDLQQEANKQLEAKVHARTAEIAYQKEQIEEQNEELKALNEEKNSLIRIVAHDLKSPLNRITGLINVIKLSPDNLTDEQMGYLDLISMTGQKLKNMVMQILDVDAIDDHNPNLLLETVNAVDFISERTSHFEERAKEKYIDLNFQAAASCLPVMVDVNYFEQIFENLLSNALKFSPKGKSITIGVEQAGRQLKLYVSDEGPGLTQEDQLKLFKKYQKLSAQPTDGEDSTGLGLSIVKRYVDLLGGKIWCESEYRKGATFIVMLPLAEETALVA